MSIKKIHDDQPKEFKFSSENLKKIDQILKRYPEKKQKKCSDALALFSSKTER